MLWLDIHFWDMVLNTNRYAIGKTVKVSYKGKKILFDSVWNYRAGFICKLVVLNAILKHFRK